MSSRKKKFAQFFSPAGIADLLVQQIEEPISSVLDLAAGKGDLLLASLKKFGTIEACAVDIDASNVALLTENVSGVQAYRRDALKIRALKNALSHHTPFDLVVGNPPYMYKKVNRDAVRLVKDILGLDVSHYRSVRTEIVFLALSLALTKHKGFVSIILPKALAAGAKYEKLRLSLLKNHQLIAAIDLPPKSFTGTEAETTIFIMRKGVPTVDTVALYKANSNGSIVGFITIPVKDAIHRLDFDFCRWNLESPAVKATLGDLGGEVVRGNISLSLSKKLDVPLFHTNHFKLAVDGVIFLERWKENRHSRYVTASRNDILIPRVGRDLKKSALIGAGSTAISDCVFRLRIPKLHLEQLRASLSSANMDAWLQANASGTCAKILTYKDVLNIPIYWA